MLEWDDTAPQAFLGDYSHQASKWDAEEIPFGYRDHGLRNRIVRMPLKQGAEVMTLEGSADCNRLVGRIRNRHLGSM